MPATERTGAAGTHSFSIRADCGDDLHGLYSTTNPSWFADPLVSEPPPKSIVPPKYPAVKTFPAESNATLRPRVVLVPLTRLDDRYPPPALYFATKKLAGTPLPSVTPPPKSIMDLQPPVTATFPLLSTATPYPVSPQLSWPPKLLAQANPPPEV